ncbi:hypothetical protein MHC_04540 [Mycoplasma haemocanis str. Illinois]|uniref:Uncharacterized protein n=1 Tax=Mycoplasma haemocanis (strain Illinois) TaxID=1111676 RepID=H6N7Z2_MYCHN|nr:hypothetical protein [Mycoplasma haemocanis]AEW45764.1 hypothetical protein MHC_04540 [Mycoplasma haemocanis str. Illinois]
MKLGIAVSLIGGASAAGGYYYLSHKEIPVSIRSSLKDFKLISTLTGDSLTKQWVAEFKSAKDDIKSEIEELKDVAGDDEGGRKLESWCSKQMDLEAKKYPETFELVKKYCLIRDLSSQISRNKKTLLRPDQSSEWTSLYQKKKSGTATRADVGLGGTTWEADKEKDELPTIQNWCNKTSRESFLASDNDSKYNKLIEWCTSSGQ